MTASLANRPDLRGMTILIVEDEFYLAMDMQDEIERAGGAVIGPFADQDTGLAAIRRSDADFALVDINLGTGPSFEMADALLSEGVPFMFLTGYDASTIPARFNAVQRLPKPANVMKLLEVLERQRTG